MYKIYYSVVVTLKKETDSYSDVIIHHMSGHQKYKNDFSFDVEKAKNDSLKDDDVINDIKNKYELVNITVLEILKIKEKEID